MPAGRLRGGLTAMYVVTDHTRGHTIQTTDWELAGRLQWLWLCWGHTVSFAWVPSKNPHPPRLTVVLPHGSRPGRTTTRSAG